MNIILEDISQLFWDFKNIIKKKIDNKFCSYCNKWLHNKSFIFDKENSCYFCDENCQTRKEENWKMIKYYMTEYVNKLVDIILPENMISNVGVYTDVKSLGWDKPTADGEIKI